MSVYNFCAGPSMLPDSVMNKIKTELLDWQQGMSVMEFSHRGPEFVALAKKSELNLRTLLKIPENYKVLFLQGGARLQFSMVPINLFTNITTSVKQGTDIADYAITGIWSKIAADEAARFGNIAYPCDTLESGYTSIPDVSTWNLNENARYIHICDNETINGVEFRTAPKLPSNIPLVSDMSSNLLSKPLDVSNYGVIYASAQKNVGPAGLTLVIIREDLISELKVGVSSSLNYKTWADTDSMYATPPTFSWYGASLMFEWLLEQGGLEEIEKRNIKKANLLYDYIDSTNFYKNNVEKKSRSMMNVPFIINVRTNKEENSELEKKFVKEANDNGLKQLSGHRFVGGMRASIYNSMPIEGVMALISFMQKFAKENG